jgi:exopolysaccharide production protein ExoQ
MNKLLMLEKAFSIFTLTLFSGAILVLILSGGSSQGDNAPDTDFAVINIIFLGLYFIAFCLLVLRWRKTLYTIYQGWLIWLLIGFSITSIIWSALPNMTFNRLIALCGTAIFSIYFSSRFTIKEQLELIAWTFGIAAIMSLAFALALPQYGQMASVHAGLWRGVYNNKNALGKTMGIAAVVFLILAQRKESQRWIYWGLLGLSIFLLIMSKASSPLINLIVVIMAFFMLQTFRWQYALMMPALSGIALIGFVLHSILVSNADVVASIFEKDLTFSGRTDLWPLVIDKIEQQPWLGHGFGAFWNGREGPSKYVWDAIFFEAPNAHNGFLDILLELGIVGLTIYALQFFVCFINSLTYIRFNRTPDGLWPGLLLLYIVLSNLTESGLFIQNNIFLVLQLSTFLSLGLEQSDYAEEFFAEEEI